MHYSVNTGNWNCCHCSLFTDVSTWSSRNWLWGCT